jgi:hypothetical protein
MTLNWVRKWPVYKEGLQERGQVRAIGLEEGIQPDKVNRSMGRKCEKAGEKMVHLDISCSPLALSPLLFPCL